MKKGFSRKEIEHKSTIVQVLFLVYIICIVILIATGISDHGIRSVHIVQTISVMDFSI